MFFTSLIDAIKTPFGDTLNTMCCTINTFFSKPRKHIFFFVDDFFFHS